MLALVVAMLAVSYVLGQRHREHATGSPYESGIVSTGSAHVRLSDVKDCGWAGIVKTVTSKAGNKARLTHTLLAIANEERLGRLPKMSQQTLAEMIGMTRQYVNVLLKEFRQSSSCQPDMNSFMFPSPAEMAVKNHQSRKHKG